MKYVCNLVVLFHMWTKLAVSLVVSNLRISFRTYDTTLKIKGLKKKEKD